ncbi:MAG: hypothetical protein ABL894_09925 [Hyphomicrobium sp.]
MENLAELLKLLFEKGSWLAGVALVGLAITIARWLGFLDDVDKNALHAVYLVSAVCASVLLTGGVVSLWKHLKDKRKENGKLQEIRKKAVANFPTLPPDYLKSLAWMYAFNRRTVSVDIYAEVLETLSQQGYLERDFPEEYHVVKTYTVTDEIWAELEKADRTELKRNFRENEPPWLDASWRI